MDLVMPLDYNDKTTLTQPIKWARQLSLWEGVVFECVSQSPKGMSLTGSTMAGLSVLPSNSFCYHIRTRRLVMCHMRLPFKAKPPFLSCFTWLSCICGGIRCPLVDLISPTCYSLLKKRGSHTRSFFLPSLIVAETKWMKACSKSLTLISF